VLRVDTVEPATVPYGEQTPVVLRGLFQPRLRLDIDGQREPSVEDVFEVEIDGTWQLEGKAATPDRLELTVPAELPVGAHDLSVREPFGQRVTRMAALTVVPAR